MYFFDKIVKIFTEVTVHSLILVLPAIGAIVLHLNKFYEYGMHCSRKNSVVYYPLAAEPVGLSGPRPAHFGCCGPPLSLARPLFWVL